MSGPQLRRRPSRLLRLALAVGFGILGGLIAVQATEIAWLRRLELVTLDWRYAVRGPLAPSGQVVIVAIDDASVERIGVWPPSRASIAEGVRALDRLGVRVLAFDLLLAEERPALDARDRRALLDALRDLPAAATAARAALQQLLQRAEPDLELAVAIQTARRVVTPYALVFEGATGNIAGIPPWIRASSFRAWTAPPPGTDLPPEPSGLLVPAAGLAAGGAGVGHVTTFVDVDGSVRADIPAYPLAGLWLPSLPVETLRVALGLGPEALFVTPGRLIAIGEIRAALDPAARLLVNHYGPAGTIPTLSLATVLDDPEAAAPLVRDRTVVLGITATAAGDRFVTPFSRRLPGVEHLATVVDNLLTERSLVRDHRVLLADGLASLALAGLAASLVGRRSQLWSWGWMLLLAGGWVALAVLAFREAALWLGMIVPLTTLLLCAVTVELARIAAERRRHRLVERQRFNLGRYFPPKVVDRLADADSPASLDRTSEAAVMFVDMVGSTRLCEGLPPAEAMALLREFHERIGGTVFAHGGMVDKFHGDGALCCFGVPEPHAADAADALRAARAILAAIDAWNAARSVRGAPPVRAAIGLHAGPVLTGDLGGGQQLQFTVIGDTVNVASRLEAATRLHGTALILSDEALRRALAHDLEAARDLVRLPPLVLRGREETLEVWMLRPAAAARAAAAQ